MADTTELPWHQLPIPDQIDQIDGLRLLLRPIIDPQDGEVQIGHNDIHMTTLNQLESGSNKIYGLVQRKRDVKVRLKVLRKRGPTFGCSLYYRPNSDQMVFANSSREMVKVTGVDGVRSVSRIEPGQSVGFGYGLWQLEVGNRPILEWTALPPPPISIKKPEVEQDEVISPSGAEQSTKRRRILTPGDNTPGVEHSKSNDKSHGSEIQRKVPASGVIDLREGETLYLPSVDGEDSYQITMEKKIASNHSSELFRARHSSYGECIVVKVNKTQINEDGTWIRSQSETWLREYTIQSRMDHETVVKLKGWDARYLSLYLEHVPSYDLGSSLQWRSSDHYFIGTRTDVQRVFLDVARALTYIHAQGVKHNDIKPGNILYSPDRGAIVCDFGISEPISSHQLFHAGTPWYVPPEHGRIETRDTPGDVWALGITMLYLFRLIPLPEKDVRAEAWRIADIASKDLDRHSRATKGRNHWRNIVGITCQKLSLYDRLHTLARGMLQDEPKNRITADELSQALEGMGLDPATTHDDTTQVSSAETESTDILSPWAYGDADAHVDAHAHADTGAGAGAGADADANADAVRSTQILRTQPK